MTFATFGGSLKIFSLDNGKIHENLCYSNANCGEIDGKRNISWSGDGQWIVGPIENGGALPVFKLENLSRLTRMRHFRDANASTAVFMNCTNRLIAVGSKSGSVQLWNIKEKKTQQVLCQSGTEPVKLMQISADDMYVATAGVYSHVKIYGLTTNQLTNTLTTEYPSEFSDLKFSTIKKNYLACSSLEGSVVVWDVYKSVSIMDRRNAHIGACTGISMSPINHNVVASVALSDSFMLHDIRTKATVLEAKVGVLGSCVELLRNEPFALIGSRDGRLIVYDLRTSSVLSDEAIHQEPITCVRAAFMANTKPYENVIVGTPENEITKCVGEMSVADIFTPPSSNQIPQSKLASISLVDALSPIAPATGQHRATIDKTTSTPNQPQLMDSFLKIFDSPSRAEPVVTTSFQFRPSPLTAVVQPPPVLNGIHEVPEEETVNGPNNVQEIIRTELSAMKDELLQCFKNVIRNEVSQVQQQFLEFKTEILSSIERNRFAIYKTVREIEELRNVIRLEQVVNEIINNDDTGNLISKK